MEMLDAKGLKRLTLALERKVGRAGPACRCNSWWLCVPTMGSHIFCTPHRPPSVPLQYNANLEVRMKHPDHPDKWMQSEGELDEAVRALLVAASAPDLYPELVRGWVGAGWVQEGAWLHMWGGGQGRVRRGARGCASGGPAHIMRERVNFVLARLTNRRPCRGSARSARACPSAGRA